LIRQDNTSLLSQYISNIGDLTIVRDVPKGNKGWVRLSCTGRGRHSEPVWYIELHLRDDDLIMIK
jgi:hypothetical protein